MAQYGLGLLPPTLAALWLVPGPGRVAARRAVLAAGLSCALAVAIVVGLDAIGGLGRVRPFAALGLVPLVPHSADASFPSDHALVSAAVAWPLLARRPGVGAWCLLVALIVGLARVAAGLHFPSDVLGSALLAALPAAAGLGLETALAGTPLVRRATGQGLGEERST